MKIKKTTKKIIAYVCAIVMVFTGLAGYNTNVTAGEDNYISIGQGPAIGSTGKVEYKYIVKSASDASGKLVKDMGIMPEDNKLVLWGADSEIMSIKLPSAEYSGAKIIINGNEAGEIASGGYELQVKAAETFNNNAYNTVRIQLGTEFYEYEIMVGDPTGEAPTGGQATTTAQTTGETPVAGETTTASGTPSTGDDNGFISIGASKAMGTSEVPFAYKVAATSGESGNLVKDMTIMSKDNKLVLWGADNEKMSIKVPSAAYSGSKIIINGIETGEVATGAFEVVVEVADVFNNNAYNTVRIQLGAEFYEYQVKVGNIEPEVVQTTAAQETTKAITPATQAPTKAAPTTKKPTVKKPAKAKINSASKKKKAKTAKVSIKKIANVAGYEVKVSTSKKFKSNATITKKFKKASFTIKKLKANKKYYVKARAYKVVNKKTYTGKWSAVKPMKLK